MKIVLEKAQLRGRPFTSWSTRRKLADDKRPPPGKGSFTIEFGFQDPELVDKLERAFTAGAALTVTLEDGRDADA